MPDTTAIALPLSPVDRFRAAMTLDERDLERIRFIAVVGLVALNAADLLLTRRLLGMGGMEANPLMALFIHGPWGVAIKLALPIALGFRHLRLPVKRGLVLGLCWMCVLYLGVVLWNSHLLSDPRLLG
jgi:hypothetical protein